MGTWDKRSNHTDSSSHDVQDVCRRVRPRVQLAVLHPRLDDGVHSLLLAAPELGAREVQVGYDHHRPGHLHRCVPLHPHLQLVGRCLRVPRSRCRWPSRRPDTYRQALQRRVPLHGLAADCAAPAHGDHLLLQLDSGSGRLKGVGAPRLVGLKEAIASEGNPKVASMLTQVCYATVISWCTYPVVYLFPLLGFNDAKAVIAIQLGYCVSDIISKCGVGFLIYNITITKSAALNNSLLGKQSAPPWGSQLEGVTPWPRKPASMHWPPEF